MKYAFSNLYKGTKRISKVELNPDIIKTVPESLKKLAGKEIIRIGSTINGDWSFTNEPVLLKGFSSDNSMIIQYIKEYNIFSDERIDVLSVYFTDDNWILLEDALKSEDNELNKLIGKRIKRIRPVENLSRRYIHREDHSYMCEYGEIPPTLVSASKYHMFLKEYDARGNENHIIIGPRYSNPKDWIEAR